MTVFYILTSRGLKIGSLNCEKISKMFAGKKIYECSIEEFDGELKGSEYL